MSKLTVSLFVIDYTIMFAWSNEKLHCEWVVLELFKRIDSSTGLFMVFKECSVLIIIFKLSQIWKRILWARI